MSTELSAPSAPSDVIAGQSSPDATPAAASSPAPDTATSSADVNTQQAVQGDSTTEDPLAGLPSDDELQSLVAQKSPHAEALARIKSAYTPLKAQYDELQQKFSPFESAAERFQSAEEFQRVLDLQDSLIAWENDPQTGEPIPATQAGAQKLAEQYPQHADFLVADLLGMPTRDPETGQMVPRIDYVLQSLAENPDQKAKAARILGLVEPSAVAPQWAPTEEELTVVKPELQNIYRNLPYEEREELKMNSPDFINRVLEKEKLQQDLVARDKQTQEAQRQEAQQRELYVNQQATQAGNEYLNTQLHQALTTFHESVVQQCNFIKPLDPANLPNGMTPEQAQQMNTQIAASNKAEAAQITGLVVSLLNPQTKEYVLPLLKEIGAVDDGLLAKLEKEASLFGNNARNFGNLTFRQKLNANGNYSPTSDVTSMQSNADRSLKAMVGLANQIRGKLMERRSQFFELKATEHNQTLNGAGAVRPPVNGQGFNPATAPAASLPTGLLSRSEIDRLFG